MTEHIRRIVNNCKMVFKEEKIAMKRTAAAILILFTAAAAITGCAGKKDEEESSMSIQQIQEEEGKPVEVVTAKHLELPVTITMSGTVEAPDEVNVTPKVGGEIVAIYKDKGDSVRKGEALLQIEKKDYEIGYRQAKAAYEQAKNGLEMARKGARDEQLVQAQAKEEYDCKNYQRLKDLYEKGVSPMQQLDGAETACIASKKALEMAVTGARPEEIKVLEAQVEQAKAAMDSTKLMLERTTVTSPVDGVISYKFAVLGQGAGVKDATFQILKSGPKKISFTINEADHHRVKTGDIVTFTTAAGEDNVFKAEITYVSNHVRKMTREAEIEAVVIEEPVRLAHGSFVEGTIKLGTTDRFAVPYKALIENRYLMTVEEDAAVQNLCNNTHRVSDFVVITDGCVEPGDKVVVEGQSILNEGDRVQIKKTVEY